MFWQGADLLLLWASGLMSAGDFIKQIETTKRERFGEVPERIGVGF
jgi:hypothetical protein